MSEPEGFIPYYFEFDPSHKSKHIKVSEDKLVAWRDDVAEKDSWHSI